MLQIYDDIPAGLLDCEAQDLHTILPGPSLLHLPGDKPEPLFISVLMHGNETTGWDALRSVLQDYQGRRLPRSLSVFIGNVAAAAQGVRHLPEQPDYNRIWKAEGQHEEEVMVRQILEQMRERNVFACLDIHNNTGRNPHYACVNRLATSFFQLATLFSKTVVYFLKPDSVLSMAFAELCPAVTVECGKATERSGVQHAREFILNALALERFSDESMDVHSLEVFHTVAVVKVKEGMSIGVGEADCDLDLLPEVDRYNFHEIQPWTPLARLHAEREMPLYASNEFGKDVTERYFAIRDGDICNIVPVMPSMMTLDVDVVRQDCLCYLMERLDLGKTLST
ncbi:MAG: peptidase M14 [Gammaproteobacteria bacterium]|nr:peptidase M14 [Gammaproteobacteria bacterium]